MENKKIAQDIYSKIILEIKENLTKINNWRDKYDSKDFFR